MRRILSVKVDETCWAEAKKFVENDDTGTIVDEITYQIINTLELRTIDETLTHLGTSTRNHSTRTIDFEDVEIDENETTDFSHSEEVRMSVDAIRTKLEAIGMTIDIKTKS